MTISSIIVRNNVELPKIRQEEIPSSISSATKNVEQVRQQALTENFLQSSNKNFSVIAPISSPKIQEAAIKGLTLKNISDFQEYYDSHLLPQKDKLSSAEFSRRSVNLGNKLFVKAGFQLYTDLKEGRVILTPGGQVLNAFRSTPAWFNEVEKFFKNYPEGNNHLKAIKNFAVTSHEVFKLRNAVSSTECLIAKWLCEAIVKKELNLKKDIQLTQQAALINFLDDPKLYTASFEEMKSELRALKRNTYFVASGISAQDQQKYFPLLSILEEEWQNWYKQARELSTIILQKKKLSLKKFPLALERSTAFSENIENICRSGFKSLITQFLQNDYNSTILKERNLTILQNNLKRQILEPSLEAFYLKWGCFLKKEMIQGLKDTGEVLGSGVCVPLTLRWTIKELNKISHQAIDDLEEIGFVEAKDRFNQGMIQNGALSNVESKMGVTHKYLKPLPDITGKDAFTQYINHLISDPSFANLYHGVGQLCLNWHDKKNGITGHALAITCEENSATPSKSVFRLIDPNIGAFQFKVNTSEANAEVAKKEFVDCLSDLLLFYSGKMDMIHCRCYEVK